MLLNKVRNYPNGKEVAVTSATLKTILQMTSVPTVYTRYLLLTSFPRERVKYISLTVYLTLLACLMSTYQLRR